MLKVLYIFIYIYISIEREECVCVRRERRVLCVREREERECVCARGRERARAASEEERASQSARARARETSCARAEQSFRSALSRASACPSSISPHSSATMTQQRFWLKKVSLLTQPGRDTHSSKGTVEQTGLVNMSLYSSQKLLLINWPNKRILSFMNTD